MSIDGYVTATSSYIPPETHRDKMLEALHQADFWHDHEAHNRINKKKKLMHRKYQIAIWWAIQQIEVMK